MASSRHTHHSLAFDGCIFTVFWSRLAIYGGFLGMLGSSFSLMIPSTTVAAIGSSGVYYWWSDRSEAPRFLEESLSKVLILLFVHGRI